MINNIQEQKDSLLPPPEILVKYQELGINEDLLELVKMEQEHRHILQKKYQLSYRMGQLFGFILSLVFILGIFKLINNSYITEAYVISGIFVATLIVLTVLVRKNNKRTTTRRTTTTRAPRSTQPRRGSRNYNR